jgi:hypothetical protein
MMNVTTNRSMPTAHTVIPQFLKKWEFFERSDGSRFYTKDLDLGFVVCYRVEQKEGEWQVHVYIDAALNESQMNDVWSQFHQIQLWCRANISTRKD